jgi:type I restriction enzyme S subunit
MRPFFLQHRRGIRQKNLTLGMIKSFNTPLPPLSLQSRLADFGYAADKSKFELQKGMSKLQNLYKSLLQKSFNGELF